MLMVPRPQGKVCLECNKRESIIYFLGISLLHILWNVRVSSYSGSGFPFHRYLVHPSKPCITLSQYANTHDESYVLTYYVTVDSHKNMLCNRNHKSDSGNIDFTNDSVISNKEEESNHMRSTQYEAY